jgi:hypothetical protein
MLSEKPYLRRALLFAFGLKLFYLLLGNLLPNGWNGLEHVLDVFARNDSGWYHLIAREGYPTEPPLEWQQTSFAFFPLYPALVALFRQPMLLFFHNIDLVYVLASMALHIFLTLIWVTSLFAWLGDNGWEARRIFKFSIFFQVFPYHFFYHMFYSEVLFSILFMQTLIALNNKNYIRLSISVALLTLCRPTGIVFSAGLGLWILADNGWFRIFKQKENIKPILALLGAPGALILWMLYLYFHCGDPFAFSHTQTAWGHTYTWPWETLFNSGEWYQQAMSVYALVLIIITFVLFRRARLGEQIFTWLNVLFPLITGLVASYYRYVSVIPNLFLRIYTIIELRWKWVVIACMLLNMLLFYVWVSIVPPRPEAWLTY